MRKPPHVPEEFHSPDEVAVRKKPRDKDVYDLCCKYMYEKKPFLVSAFRLEDLATGVMMNTTYVSRSVNKYYGDFRIWVNEFRVNHAMELFRRNNALRVSELAWMCGFQSVNTFNLNFKAFVGISPSVWCQKIKEENQYKARKRARQKWQLFPYRSRDG